MLWHLHTWLLRCTRYYRRQAKYTEAVHVLHASTPLLSEALEHPQMLVSPRGSWDPSPVDMEGQLCGVQSESREACPPQMDPALRCSPHWALY